MASMLRGAFLLCWLIGCADDETPPTIDPPLTPAPTAAELVARVMGCANRVGGLYAPSSGQTADIAICAFPAAVAWQADMDVDCDGKQSSQCNLMTDRYYMPDTSAHDSHGDPLDAAVLPFVVIPGRSTRFDYRGAQLAMGTLVAVIYEDKIAYGPLGDIGPVSIIGEASYAMAAALGIDPDPSIGGVASGVTYIAFTGDAAKLTTIEDREEADALGTQLALDLLAAP